MSTAIQGLVPETLWRHFAQVSAIPRPSRGEHLVADHVIGLARQKGLETVRDDIGNVIVRKPASAEHRRAPGVVLHAHLDMVCEKDSSSNHDFERDPIRLRRFDNYITSDGTTLGADNGIGVAAALAVLLDEKLAHGPLECLFTVDEETSFSGVLGLSPGLLKGRILLNLDTDADGIFCVGSAGGGDTLVTLPVRRKAVAKGYTPIGLVLRGLQGGHSGLEIHRGRANAVKLMGRALLHIAQSHDVRVSGISGGDKANAIPREAQAVAYVRGWQVRPFRKTIEEINSVLREEYSAVEPYLTLEVSQCDPEVDGTVLKRADEEALLGLIYALPHGVIGMSAKDPQLVETSTNLAWVRTGSGSVRLLSSQRGSVKTAFENTVTTIRLVAKLSGATIVHRNLYPPWKPNYDSAVLRAAGETYWELFKREPHAMATHGGLECGVISAKYPDMDILSFGPTIEHGHTPRERVEIASVARFWTLLLALLKNLS